jgi:ribosomal protein L37AE/L43A
MNMKEYAESLGLFDGESRRMNCPSCGHKNTFSVTNYNAELMWNCFHADCTVKGRANRRITLANVDTLMSKTFKKRIERTVDCPIDFVKPKSWSRTIPEIGKTYTETVNTSGRYDDIYFDVVKDRLVYAIHDKQGRLVDGAGRSMTGARPKWYRYGNYRGGFRIGTSDTAFVVEDIPSAISISDWVTGYALLGTSLRDEHIDDLIEFKQVVVALDKDATDKALTYMRVLNSVVPTGLLMLDKDLKTLGDEERGSLIRTAMLGK